MALKREREKRIYDGRAKLSRKELEMMHFCMKQVELSQSELIRFLIRKYYEDLVKTSN